MKIFIPGGAGYIGAFLVPWLLAKGHHVTVYDTKMFGGGYLPTDNENLGIITGDIRDDSQLRTILEGHDAVIHLAGITRNKMCEDHPKLASAVNIDGFCAVLKAAKDVGVKRFIYASSVAVYGSSDDDLVETMKLNPTTAYGIGKRACEYELMCATSNDFICTAVRSASVCGYSPNMRLDLTVNMMVHDAIKKGVITVNGGSQVRSHVHMTDLADFYGLLLDTPADRISGQGFNVVRTNMSMIDTAELVVRALNKVVAIHTKPYTDDRSYSVDGTKASRVLKFTPKKKIEDAVNDIRIRFESGYWKDSLTNPYYQRMASVAA